MPKRIIEVEPGTRIRVTFTGLDEAATEQAGHPVATEITVEGYKGREVGMARLGNLGFLITTDTGEQTPISRYSLVEVEGEDYPAPATPDVPLNLWTLTRVNTDLIKPGDMHEMIVAAHTEADARDWAVRAATLRNDRRHLIWRDRDEFTVRVSHLGEANADQDSGVVIASTWQG